MDAYQRQADGRYKRVAHSLSARVGAAGIGAASEAVSRTPAGRFRLSQPFGLQADPGVRGAPYLRVGRDDVRTGSTGTVLDEHRRCAPGTCPAAYGAFERLSGYPGLDDHGFIENASATGGCVAVDAAQMRWLLTWLRFGTSPVVSIGLGATPYGVIPNRSV